jgi:hypothetical protein
MMRRTLWPVAALTVVLLGCAAGTGATPSPAASDSAAPAPVSEEPATPAPTAAPDVIHVSVAFDGTNCTYSGPAVFLRGSIILVAYKAIGPAAEDPTLEPIMVVGAVRDGTTWEQVVGANKASQWPTEWASTTDFRAIEPPEGVVYLELTRNTYVALCVTSPESTNLAVPAAMIRVIDG